MITARVSPGRRGSYGFDAPFAPAFLTAMAGFDLVVSNFAIHNISGRAGREKAVSEAVRVLRPGGRLLIVDVRGTRHHRAQLARMGMTEVARRWLGWRLMAPLVTATKPQRRS